MGFMDKVKAQAGQAMAKAQQGVAQGQAKLDAAQAKRQADALLRDLGAAYYAEQRSGGPHDAVEAALAKLDEHAETHGPVETAPTAAEPGATVPAQGGPGKTTGGNFDLSDI